MDRELLFDRFSQQALHTLQTGIVLLCLVQPFWCFSYFGDFLILISYTHYNMSILWTTDRLSLKYRNGY